MMNLVVSQGPGILEVLPAHNATKTKNKSECRQRANVCISFQAKKISLKVKSKKYFMQQQQHGFSGSTPRAGSDDKQNRQNVA